MLFRWLCQLRVAPYSYDWIDNDGQPSADRIIPELQQLQGGDQILMLPGMGPRVREVEPTGTSSPATRKLASGAWPCTRCRRLPAGQPVAGGLATNPVTAFWILLSDPGAFIMERKMLKGIRSRAEAMVQDRSGVCRSTSAPKQLPVRPSSFDVIIHTDVLC